MKSSYISYPSHTQRNPVTLDRLAKVSILVDETISKFNSKYYEASNLLNDMRFEFLGQMSSIIDMLSGKKSGPSTETRTAVSGHSPIKVNSRIKSEKNSRTETLNQTQSHTALQTESSDKAKAGDIFYQTRAKKSISFHRTFRHNDSKHSSKVKPSRNKIISNPNPLINSAKHFGLKKSNTSLKTFNSKLMSGRSVDPNKSLKFTQSGNLEKIDKELWKHHEMIEALKIVSLSKVTPLKTKMNIKYLNKELYNTIDIRDIWNQSKEIIEKRLNKIQSICNFDIITERKYPSRTAQVGLNFLTHEKQTEIINDNSNQNKKCIEVIYSILDEDDRFNYLKNSSELFKFLFDKYKKKNVKELFFDIIYQKIFIDKDITNEKWKAIDKIYSGAAKEFEEIENERDKSFFWVMLNIKEIYEYLAICFSKDVKFEEYENLKLISSKIDSFLSK